MSAHPALFKNVEITPDGGGPDYIEFGPFTHNPRHFHLTASPRVDYGGGISIEPSYDGEHYVPGPYHMYFNNNNEGMASNVCWHPINFGEPYYPTFVRIKLWALKSIGWSGKLIARVDFH